MLFSAMVFHCLHTLVNEACTLSQWSAQCISVRLTSSYFFAFDFTDEKEKYDPLGFRDAIFKGLNEAGNDLEQAYKFLDSAGGRLDYRRYTETLLDILLAGGILGT